MDFCLKCNVWLVLKSARISSNVFIQRSPSMLGPKPSSQTQQFHRDIFFLWQMSLSQKIHEMFPHQRLQMKKYIKRIFGKKYDVRKRRKTILQEKKKISFQFVRNENERFSAWSILLSFSSDSTERKLQ